MQRMIVPVTSVALGLIVMAAAGTDALGQASHAEPSGRKIVAETRFDVTDAPAQAELVQLVVDFEPGAWTSIHTHGGQAIDLVLDGELTLRQNGVDRVYKSGQAWTESIGQVHAAGNTGSGKARLLTNFLLPMGAPQILVVQEPQLGPGITFEARFPLSPLPPNADIVQQVVDLPPGWRAERAYDGVAASLIMAGEVTYQIGPERKSYKPGDAVMLPGNTPVVEESNGQARVFMTYLVAKGAAP
jgi:quercetin dioxygenase-like cupin family protein